MRVASNAPSSLSVKGEVIGSSVGTYSPPESLLLGLALYRDVACSFSSEFIKFQLCIILPIVTATICLKFRLLAFVCIIMIFVVLFTGSSFSTPVILEYIPGIYIH